MYLTHPFNLTVINDKISRESLLAERQNFLEAMFVDGLINLIIASYTEKSPNEINVIKDIYCI